MFTRKITVIAVIGLFSVLMAGCYFNYNAQGASSDEKFLVPRNDPATFIVEIDGVAVPPRPMWIKQGSYQAKVLVAVEGFRAETVIPLNGNGGDVIALCAGLNQQNYRNASLPMEQRWKPFFIKYSDYSMSHAQWVMGDTCRFGFGNTRTTLIE